MPCSPNRVARSTDILCFQRPKNSRRWPSGTFSRTSVCSPSSKTRRFVEWMTDTTTALGSWADEMEGQPARMSPIHIHDSWSCDGTDSFQLPRRHSALVAATEQAVARALGPAATPTAPDQAVALAASDHALLTCGTDWLTDT